ncbi:MAG: BatD family protein [Pseudomonadales bacterium]
MRLRTQMLVAMLGVLTALPSAAALVTYLEPRIVDEMETVRLVIRAEGTAQAEAPDFSPLDEDFDVLGNQTSSRISSINGRTVASVEYQLNLRPKRTGEIVVPSLAIGGERTEPIRLVVRPLDPAVRESIEKMVFFETELSANPVYVQAQTVLTRRLYYSQGVQIYSDLPGVPDVAHAVVIPLGETQSRSVLRDGQRYGVIEQRFALFPERSGSLTIPSISVTSSVRVQAGGRTRRSGVRVSTEAIELTVKPIPASYPADAAWLPATEVSLTQRWLPPREAIDVGEPLTFELDVRATGNRGSAIPPIPLPLPPERFKIYPEAPVMEETARDGTIIGDRRTRYALIPTEPGALDVPPLVLTWWDTDSDRLRQARVAVAELTITGMATPSPPVAVPETGISEPDPVPAPPSRTATPPWLVTTLVAAAVAIAAVALLRIFWRGDGPSLPGWMPRRAGHEHRLAWRELRSATAGSDPAAYRRALCTYLASGYHLPPAEALAAFRGEADVAPRLDALDRAIYARRTARADAGRPDMESLTLLAREALRRRRRRPDTGALPALYG